MRSFLLAGLCLFLIKSPGKLLAQNKTLGVGVTAPNANAALHIESPTANQGFIMPRLTTVQRTGMNSILTVADKGLMLFDTDLNTIFIWNGAAWQTTGQVAGGIKLTYPYKDSVVTNTGTPDLFALKYYSDEPKRIMRIENQSPTNGSSTLSVYTAGQGLGGYFQVANPASTSSTLYATTNSDAGGDLAPVAVYGESTGIGSLGGSFRNQNAGNPHPALFAETKGTGVSIMAITSTGFSAVQGEAVGGFSNGVSGLSSSPEPGSFAILGTNSGGGPAGVFNIPNSANSSTVLSANTAGQGSAGLFEQTNTTAWSPALMTRTDGQGAAFNATSSGVSTNANAAEFIVQNVENPRNAVMAVTEGTGSAGSFLNNNAANPAAAVVARTNGSGAAVQAENNGTGDGFAGSFHNMNSTNTYPAIQASTAGDGSGVRVMQTNGPGAGIDIYMQNSASSAPGFIVDHAGLGTGATINVQNGVNTSSALFARTMGTGDAAFFEIDNTSSTNTAVKGRVVSAGGGAGAFEIFNNTNARDAIFSITQGNGSAGNFNVDNTSSTNSAIIAKTNGLGTALLVDHTGGGGNIAIFQDSSQNVARIDKNGQGLFNGGTASSGADVAEMFDVEGERNAYEPGDVLVISEDTDRTVEKSDAPVSTKVAGVYATKPGVRLTERNLNESLDDLVPMGVIGVIPTKVCLENGPIKRGDLLVTSSKRGHAMKAVPANVGGVLIYPTGAILGKALENFDGQESGLIKVLVNVK